MSRVLIEGFEQGNTGSAILTDNPLIKYKDDITSPFIPPVKGLYCLESGASSSPEYATIPLPVGYTSMTSFYFRVRVQPDDDAHSEILYFISPEGITIGGVGIGNYGLPYITSDGVDTQSSGPAIVIPYVWNLIEGYVTISSTRSSEDGAFNLKINGLDCLDLTDFNFSASSSQLTLGYIKLGAQYSLGVQVLYDDVVIDSESCFGSPDTYVIGFTPNAVGTSTEWDPSEEGEPNYTMVNEVGDFETVDANYIYTETNALQDSYQMLKQAGSGDFDRIYAIQPLYRAKRVGPDYVTSIKPYLLTNGTTTYATSIPVPHLNYMSFRTQAWETVPVTEVAWTETFLESTDFNLGVESEQG